MIREALEKVDGTKPDSAINVSKIRQEPTKKKMAF
jgi:hypothetical protein